MADIRPADDIDFARFYGGVQVTGQWIGRGLWRRRLLAGFGCVIETGEGEWMAFLEVPAEARKPCIFRHILEVLAQAKTRGARVIKATCDTSIPRAEALMLKLGFKPTNETLDGKVVWQWVS